MAAWGRALALASGGEKPALVGSSLHKVQFARTPAERAWASHISKNQEICGDFKQNNCTRGDRCRYSHVTTGGNDGICSNFRRGHCSRGDTCKFSHELPGGAGSEDWMCPGCGATVFALKSSCYKCGVPRPATAGLVDVGEEFVEPPPVPGIKFGVRGDGMLQTFQPPGTYGTFKSDFEKHWGEIFENCTVDYSINPGDRIDAVTRAIAQGPAFDYLCVGICIQDLMDPKWKMIVPFYPEALDAELQKLAVVMKLKATASMVWVAGPAEFFVRLPRWDYYLEHARNTLRKAGVQVVPSETAAFVFKQMTLSSDREHITDKANVKEVFAKAWATCLYAAASDPTWGREITAESVDLTFASTGVSSKDEGAAETNPSGVRARSRSPARDQPSAVALQEARRWFEQNQGK